MNDLQQAAEMALKNLEGIVNSNWRDWEELASPEEFERWVKSRANHSAEALRQALEQGEQEAVAWLDSDGFPWSKEGIECRTVKDTYTPLYAGKSPVVEQEPVAWRYKICREYWTYSEKYPDKEFAGDAWERWQVTPLYTAPPSKPWVSLSDEDITRATGEVYGNIFKAPQKTLSFAKAIEAALKEKNNG